MNVTAVGILAFALHLVQPVLTVLNVTTHPARARVPTFNSRCSLSLHFTVHVKNGCGD